MDPPTVLSSHRASLICPSGGSQSHHSHKIWICYYNLVCLARGSREAVHVDVENELREAMSDTVKEEGKEMMMMLFILRRKSPVHPVHFNCISNVDTASLSI